MKFLSTLAMAALAGLAASAPVPQDEGAALFIRGYPSSDYNCPSADFQGCSLDGTMVRCANNVASLFTCAGGCQITCPDNSPCLPPTCNGAVAV
ncbi:hypothetical protein N7456_000938 [Penicillium angulare]|uniref:Uncharacterized protein n=1 Tax=Penicillium angulare TaxID=116970 RepID=A0A9W9GE35_9EURO|nr:hypothetical protein N7456_000938 [Penicillium angulare]